MSLTFVRPKAFTKATVICSKLHIIQLSIFSQILNAKHNIVIRLIEVIHLRRIHCGSDNFVASSYNFRDVQVVNAQASLPKAR